MRINNSVSVLIKPTTLLASVLVLAVLAAGLPANVAAQQPRSGICGMPAIDSSQSLQAPWSFGAWFSGGTHEPLKTREGHVEDRALYLIGIRASRPLNQWRSFDLRYTPTFVPGIIATANREYKTVDYPDGDVGLIPYKKTAFGVGMIPIALEARLAASDRAGLVIGAGGGAAYFDRRIPDPEETRFNFLADGHAGLYLRSPIGTTTVGFRLQHISNGNTGHVNPGMDSRMLYIGFGH